MAGETVITVVGNLTADPELRFTPNGAAVANFTVASTPRTFDRQTNEWKDGEALFLRCSVWREAAENVAESLTKGMRVIVQGRLRARSYDDRDGNRRTSWELDVDEVGPALRFATAKVTRAQRGGGGGGGFGGGGLFFLYLGGFRPGLPVGTVLPSGGTRINPGDTAARQRAGLPATGKVSAGQRVSGGIGSGIGGKSGTGAGS